MDVNSLVRSHLADPGSTWAIGTFGAIAEFHRTPTETATMTPWSVTTARGGIRLEPGVDARIVAWERPTGGDRWTQGLAFCLDEAAGGMHRREVVTELGPDHDALATEERDSVLFDLGIAAPHCDVCVRTGDAALLRRLRTAVGASLLDSDLMPALVAASPTRVFLSKLGRLEVRTPIPAADGTTPDGPHTHVLPDLLRLRRTHAATVPLPARTVPAAELFPPSAIHDPHARAMPFDAARHDDFQALLDRHGLPACNDAKAATLAAVRAGRPPQDDPRYGRAQRLARRVALRQLLHTDGPSVALAAWRREFDRED